MQATTRASLQRVDDSSGILELLVLNHSSWTSPAYLVNDTKDWVIGGNTYVGLPFRIKLPSQANGENPRAQLQIDNIGREITSLVESLPVGSAIDATIRLSSRATPSVFDYEFVSQLSGINITPLSVSCTMGPDAAMRQTAVRIRFDPENAPALFPG
jgi:hypothetical protein